MFKKLKELQKIGAEIKRGHQIAQRPFLYPELIGKKLKLTNMGKGTALNIVVLKDGKAHYPLAPIAPGEKAEVVLKLVKFNAIDLAEWFRIPEKEKEVMATYLGRNRAKTIEAIYQDLTGSFVSTIVSPMGWVRYKLLSAEDWPKD